ncbi:MAG: 2-deoxy-5-keto-D-gluconate 6-phosphate aldolase domain-containing protein [Actinomycetota bacterium]
MTLGYGGKLFILAFDHRGSFQKKFFGIEDAPSPEEAERIIDAKRVIFQGMRRALADGLDASTAGVLVDEQFGTQIAMDAKQAGMVLAMPAEKSGQDDFDFEYGSEFTAHIESFDPTFTKVLVRYNPEGDGAMNARQSARLKELSDWLHHTGRRFLFELLVPAEPGQLEAVGNDGLRYDLEVRPDLMKVAIAELQETGIEPDVWKIEGIDDPAKCAEIAEQCRIGGRDGVACVVLGRGADDAAVDAWLRAARQVPGYQGFAIGRSIWWNPLKFFVDGAMPRDEAIVQIANNYRRFVAVYEEG